MSEWDKYINSAGMFQNNYVDAIDQKGYDRQTEARYGDTNWWQGPAGQRRRIEEASVEGWLTGADMNTYRKKGRWSAKHNPYTTKTIKDDHLYRFTNPSEEKAYHRMMERQGNKVYSKPSYQAKLDAARSRPAQGTWSDEWKVAAEYGGRSPDEVRAETIGGWFDSGSRQGKHPKFFGGLQRAGINHGDYNPVLDLYEDLDKWNPFYDKSRGGYLKNNAYDYLADALDSRKMVRHRKEIVERVQNTPGINQNTAMTQAKFDQLGLADFGLEFNADFNPNAQNVSGNPAMRGERTGEAIANESRGFLGAYNAKKKELAEKPSVMSLFKEMEEF